jgi:hypothetical protein
MGSRGVQPSSRRLVEQAGAVVRDERPDELFASGADQREVAVAHRGEVGRVPRRLFLPYQVRYGYWQTPVRHAQVGVHVPVQVTSRVNLVQRCPTAVLRSAVGDLETSFDARRPEVGTAWLGVTDTGVARHDVVNLVHVRGKATRSGRV